MYNTLKYYVIKISMYRDIIFFKGKTRYHVISYYIFNKSFLIFIIINIDKNIIKKYYM